MSTTRWGGTSEIGRDLGGDGDLLRYHCSGIVMGVGAARIERVSPRNCTHHLRFSCAGLGSWRSEGGTYPREIIISTHEVAMGRGLCFLKQGYGWIPWALPPLKITFDFEKGVSSPLGLVAASIGFLGRCSRDRTLGYGPRQTLRMISHHHRHTGTGRSHAAAGASTHGTTVKHH